MSRFFYITFADHSNVSVQAKDKDEAMSIATEHTGLKVINADIIPYPSGKQVGPIGNELGPTHRTPSFCYTPNVCKGRGSCPKQRSCVE